MKRFTVEHTTITVRTDGERRKGQDSLSDRNKTIFVGRQRMLWTWILCLYFYGSESLEPLGGLSSYHGLWPWLIITPREGLK
jgi:hypothetical protein